MSMIYVLGYLGGSAVAVAAVVAVMVGVGEVPTHRRWGVGATAGVLASVGLVLLVVAAGWAALGHTQMLVDRLHTKYAVAPAAPLSGPASFGLGWQSGDVVAVRDADGQLLADCDLSGAYWNPTVVCAGAELPRA